MVTSGENESDRKAVCTLAQYASLMMSLAAGATEGWSPRPARPSLFPSTEVDRDGEHVVVRAFLAGLPRDSFRVTVEPDAVILSGEREGPNGHGLLPFFRAVGLPKGTDTSRWEETWREGELKLVFGAGAGI